MSRPALFERAPALEALGLEHGFGMRGTAQHAVSELALARQVHGERALEVRAAAGEREADALFTSVPGLAVGVWTADCVPILLADAGGRAVAAVHSGWRGSARQIARKTVAALGERFGIEPASWFAAIGPHIGPCCYEVDDPVRAAIEPADVFSPGARPGRYQLDLHALCRAQLLAAGLRAERIARVGGCTACDSERYCSYRRDGSGGRMLHYVRMSAVSPAKPPAGSRSGPRLSA